MFRSLEVYWFSGLEFRGLKVEED